jgi:DNA-binding HxlR family transcriptional regulator
MLGKDYPNQDCSLARALEVVGERWTLLIVRDAFYGVCTFGDFATHLDIPRAVLSDRLRHLVEGGLLERRPDPDRAGRELYVLTRSGRELWPALYALMRWGARFHTSRRAPRQFTHADCAAELDEHGACPRCGTTPKAADIITIAAGRTPSREDPVSAALQAPRHLLEPLVAERR